MIRFQNKRIEQLCTELRYAPRPQKLKQIAAAEELIPIIDPNQSYPYDFICFRITEFRPKTEFSDELIPGSELQNDLAVFIYKQSCRVPEPAEIQTQRIFTVEQACEKLQVSRKTLQRWRKIGLFGRMFLFQDGHKRLAYSESVLNRFVQIHPEVLRNKRFTHVDPLERQRIIDDAKQLAQTGGFSQTQAITQISARMGRSREAIRYILKHQQDRFPDQSIIPGRKPSVGHKEIAQIFRLFRQGTQVSQLVDKFHRSRSSIYRIVNKRRAKDIFSRKINFVDSHEFSDIHAEKAILQGDWKNLCDSSSPGLTLNRDQESILFRRYNYLKSLIQKELPKLTGPCPPSEILDRVESFLQQADDIKSFLIEINLRLVISIANKHLASGTNLSDLVSEGNLSLMNAVEKFDYNRGYRFSTYASWAISKDFARQIPAEISRLDRTTFADISALQQHLRISDGESEASKERAQRGLEHVIRENLNDRERYIVQNHFALEGSGLKKKPKTLQQIGEELGLSKERVRQIELVALQKLRHSLSPEEFEKIKT